VDDVFKTLVVNGYGRGDELEADQLGIEILRASGYRPGAIADLLANLGEARDQTDGGIYSTHPGMEERLGRATGLAGPPTASPPPRAREVRFRRASKSWTSAGRTSESGRQVRTASHSTESASTSTKLISTASSSAQSQKAGSQSAAASSPQVQERFQKISDNTYRDSTTGLLWRMIPKRHIWQEAFQQPFKANKEELTGSVKWRIPGRADIDRFLLSSKREVKTQEFPFVGSFWIDEWEDRPVGGPNSAGVERIAYYVELPRGRIEESNEAHTPQAHWVLMMRAAR
jgi:hypothetical protein